MCSLMGEYQPVSLVCRAGWITFDYFAEGDPPLRAIQVYMAE